MNLFRSFTYVIVYALFIIVNNNKFFASEQNHLHEKSDVDRITKRNGNILESVPLDLSNSYISKSILPSKKRGLTVPDSSDLNRSYVTDGSFVHPFKAITDGFGQLKEILDENYGNEIDSLVVVGPIDKSDFKAMWDCIVYGNMEVLNLEYASIENDEIPDYALYDPIQYETNFWLRMRRIILPETIVKIGKAAFAMNGIQTINIPSSVKEIGSSVFAYDYWLDCDMVLPDGIEEIKYQTFIRCVGLSKAPILPKKLKIIGEHAFAETRFENIALPEGLNEIRAGAFQSSGLTEICVPQNCLNLKEMVFQLSQNLRIVNLPNELESISSGLFSMCQGLEQISIPEKCKTIESDAFFWDINLKDVLFNDCLERIERFAFDGCDGLQEIILPKSLNYIGNHSFCASYLCRVWCKSNTPPQCEDEYGNKSAGPFSLYWLVDNNAILYVPIGTQSNYANTWCWNYFPSIVETTDFPSSITQQIQYSINSGQSDIYDLNGHKIRKLAKNNIYIKDGRKFIHK